MTGNRALTPGGSVGRRTTISSYEAKAASNEKTNAAGDTPRLEDNHFYIYLNNLFYIRNN